MRSWTDAAARTLLSEATSCKPIAAMRIAVGLVLLAQARILWAYRDLLLDPRGPIPWSMSDAWVDPLAPKLSDLVALFSGWGIGASSVVGAVLGLHALAAAFFTIGYRSRLAAVVTWATFMLIRNSSTPYMYGLGAMLLIALFYSLFMPIGRAWSVDRALSPSSGEPAEPPALRSVAVLRVHLCIIYAAAAFAKAMGDQWWTGEALWRALSLPQFRQFDPAPLAAWPLALQAVALFALFSQLAYPVLVWTRLRAVIVVMAELMHLGIALFLGLWMFSIVMIALNTAAFGEAVWRAFTARRSHEPLPSGTSRDVRIIYDGACPFCDDYARYQRLRAATGRLELVDARARPEVLSQHGIEPAELEEGMVVVADGRLHRGADAMHLLAHLSEPPAKAWIRVVAAISRPRPVARFAYPFLRLGRRIALAVLGVPRFPSADRPERRG